MATSVRAYRALFDAPGTASFCLAGLIGRLPMAMTGIGVVTMYAQIRGDYGLGGAIAAVLALASAGLSPLVSRAVDRFGQSRVLLPAALVAAAAIVALVVAVRRDAPLWIVVPAAIACGSGPTLGAMVRARWTHLYRDDPRRLHTAFALESVLDEVCFVVGPIIAVGLTVGVAPEAGLLAAAVLLVGGVAWLSALRGSEPPVAASREPGTARSRPPLPRVLAPLVGVMVAMGTVFGVVDVVGVAFTDHHGAPGTATVVLASFAAGSGVAGLFFGARAASATPARQLARITAVGAVLLAPVLLASSIPMLAVLYFVAGAAVAPTMITAMTVVERIVPRARLTEGMTLTVTGIAVGVALGSSAGGQLIDRTTALTGFSLAVAAGVCGATLAAAIAVAVSRRESPRPR